MPNLSQFYPIELNSNSIVYVTGSQDISGSKNFLIRPFVNGTGILLSGEVATIETINNIVYTTGIQNISGFKNFINRPTVNNSGVVLQGEIIIPPNDPLFSGNRSITRQNIPFGTGVGGATVTEFLNNLFFPFLNPTITVNDFPILEYGVTYVGLNFTANINKNSNTGVKNLQFLQNTTPLNLAISNINEGNNSLFISNFTINETQNNNIYARMETGNQNFQILTSNPQSIIFEAPYFWGINPTILINSTITSFLTKVAGVKKPSADSKFISLTYNPNNILNYFYFVYPYGGAYGWNSSATQNGNIISILDQNGLENLNLFTAGTQFNVTLPNGKITSYITYRTQNTINLPFTFKYYFFN